MGADPPKRRSPSRAPNSLRNPQELAEWWQLVIGAIRDVVCLTIGGFLILFRSDSPTLTAIGVLLLTLSAAGAGKALVRVLGREPSDS